MSFAGLIVGLGNPSLQYAHTRHNMGFFAIDAIMQAARSVLSISGNKFDCDLWKVELPAPPKKAKILFTKDAYWLLAKPMTFMNLSGDCVQPLTAWHRISPDRLLVIHDDMDLPVGRMKLKKGGGNAGHNGLKSICERLGTPDFYRLRLGIGRSPNNDAIHWVLGHLSANDHEALNNMLPTLICVVTLFAVGDIDAATRESNGFKFMPPVE